MFQEKPDDNCDSNKMKWNCISYFRIPLCFMLAILKSLRSLSFPRRNDLQWLDFSGLCKYVMLQQSLNMEKLIIFYSEAPPKQNNIQPFVQIFMYSTNISRYKYYATFYSDLTFLGYSIVALVLILIFFWQ